MMDQTAAMDGTSIMKRLLQSIADKARMHRSACPPADNAAGMAENTNLTYREAKCEGLDDDETEALAEVALSDYFE
jgi:hypothetical protein